MKALVTGGAGFVGTNLIKRLLKDGYDVISMDYYSSGLSQHFCLIAFEIRCAVSSELIEKGISSNLP